MHNVLVVAKFTNPSRISEILGSEVQPRVDTPDEWKQHHQSCHAPTGTKLFFGRADTTNVVSDLFSAGYRIMWVDCKRRPNPKNRKNSDGHVSVRFLLKVGEAAAAVGDNARTLLEACCNGQRDCRLYENRLEGGVGYSLNLSGFDAAAAKKAVPQIRMDNEGVLTAKRERHIPLKKESSGGFFNRIPFWTQTT